MEFGLYVHLPYCRSVCPYCDFVKAPLHRAEPDRLLAALDREAELARREDGEAWSMPRTIYLGGGTPTALPAEALDRLLAGLRRRWDVSRVREFTAEANPEGLGEATLARLRAAGVNRLSLGIQSLEPAVLRTLGRIHTAEAGLGAVRRARDAGFGNVSIDLMYGVPGETREGVARGIETMIVLGVPHLSAYPLQVEEGTPFAAKAARGALALPSEDDVAERYAEVVRRLRAAGYRHYEVASFARPGFESRHNQGYWARRPYLGLGPGAHSFDGAARWRNDASIPRYLERLESGELPREEWKRLAPPEVAEERIFLGLRRDRGVRRSVLLQHRPARVVDAWERWAERGGAIARGPAGRVRPTDHGLFVAHDLAAELFARPA